MPEPVRLPPALPARSAGDRTGVAAAVFACAAVGSAVAAASLLTGYPALTGQALRYGVAAAVLAVVVRRTGRGLPRLRLREAALVVALAATGLAGFNLLLLGAVANADPAFVGLIIGCAPVLLGLAGPLLAGRAPRPVGLVAALVVSAGAALAQGGGRTSGLGLALALGVLGCEAAFSLLAVPLLPRLGPLALSAWVCAAASVLLAVTAVALHGSGALVRPTVSEALALAWLSLVVTAVAFVAWYTGVVRLGVERAGLFTGLIPVAGLASVALVGTGTADPAKLAGALVVGAGILLGLRAGRPPAAGQDNARRRTRQRPPPDKTTPATG